MMRRHLLVGLGAAVLAATALAGCGGGGAMKTVSAATTKTLGTTTATKLTLEGSSLFNGVHQSIVPPVFGRGTWDLTSGVGYQEIFIPNVIKGVVQLQSKGIDRHMVYGPDKIYLNPGRGTGTVLRHALWISAALTGSEPAGTLFSQYIEQFEGMGPQMLLSELAWGATSAKSAGTDTVEGAPADNYTVTVDLKKALAAATGPANNALRVAIGDELTRAGAAGMVSMLVSINKDGYVVKLDLKEPGSALGRVLMRFFQFGVKLTGTTPPENKVADIASVSDLGGGFFLAPWNFASGPGVQFRN